MLGQIRWKVAVAYLGLIVSSFAVIAIYLAIVTASGASLDSQFLSQLMLFLFLDALTTGILAIALAAILSHGMVQPIVRYTEIIRHLANGKLEIDVPITTTDEVGQLGIALKAMARSLGQRLSTLESERAEVSAILASMADGV
ncbi:MAG TPA: HAMP domain-containing protein, partial [Chloroflexota bacterium]|nr:HAMP domain-containing protein [Chloroflexota bacterium]